MSLYNVLLFFKTRPEKLLKVIFLFSFNFGELDNNIKVLNKTDKLPEYMYVVKIPVLVLV